MGEVRAQRGGQRDHRRAMGRLVGAVLFRLGASLPAG
jgi:hypothetical protein